MLATGLAVAFIGSAVSFPAYFQPDPFLSLLEKRCPHVRFRLSKEAERKNQVALTIDDVPYFGKTEQDASSFQDILNVLKTFEVKATFFVMSGCDELPDIEKAKEIRALLLRALTEGHELANHGKKDRAAAWMTPQLFRQDYEHCQAFLQGIYAEHDERETKEKEEQDEEDEEEETPRSFSFLQTFRRKKAVLQCLRRLQQPDNMKLLESFPGFRSATPAWSKQREEIVVRVLCEQNEMFVPLTSPSHFLSLPPTSIDGYWIEQVATSSSSSSSSSPCWFRPGCGAWRTHMLEWAQEHQLQTVLGSCYPHDPIALTKYINGWYLKKRVRAGCIIILHDRPYTAETLLQVLPELAEQFSFVTLSQAEK